jgi:predicted component of type VI protein secretion system
MDGFEGKLGKVVENVEQVTTKMATQDDIRDLKGSMMTKEDLKEIIFRLQQIQSTSLDHKE